MSLPSVLDHGPWSAPAGPGEPHPSLKELHRGGEAGNAPGWPGGSAQAGARASRVDARPGPDAALAAPEGDPAGLVWLSRARAGEGHGRAAALAEWRAHLAKVPGSTGERAALAAALLGALEQGDLGTLDGWRGVTARSLAVEALLSLGYPHALEVHPDDLGHLREVQARGMRGAVQKGLRACLVASLGGQAILATLWVQGWHGSLLGAGAAGVVAVLAPLAAASWLAWVRASPWILHPNVRPVD